MDQLTRAWNLLEPGERPEGLDAQGGWWEGPFLMSDRAAYDRLCQAVEGVLLRRDLWLTDRYKWGRLVGEYDIGFDEVSNHEDRLTAACNALEAERGQR